MASRTAGCCWLVCEQQELPAEAAPRGVTCSTAGFWGFCDIPLKVLVLSMGSSLGICLIQWRSGGFLLALVTVTHCPWSLSPPWCDCSCESTPGSPWPVLQDSSQSLLPGCAGLWTADERSPWEMLLLYSQSLCALGAPDKSQLPSPAEHCCARAHTQPCPAFRQQCGQHSQLRTPDKPNSLFLLSSQAAFALCSL